MKRCSRPRLEALEAREVPALIAALDPSFGTNGRASVANATLLDTALQADGKVVAVGTQGGNVLVARFNPDGSPDTTFDGDGFRTIDFTGTDIGNAVAVQADGKIVVVGNGGPGGDALVARLNPDGSSDATFNGGSQTVNFGSPTDSAQAVAIQSDGKIVVAGGNGLDFALVRLNTNGTVDVNPVTFDGGAGQVDSARAVAVQSDGRIVVAGTNGLDFVIARRDIALGQDNTFNGTGIQTVNFGGNDVANDVTIQPDGKIVAAGDNFIDIAVVRLNPNGSRDQTFGADGKLTVDVSGGADQGAAVRLLPDGKIVVVGTAAVPGDIAVVRLNPDGSFDPSFSGDGKATASTGGTEVVNAAALTATGRVVVVGTEGTTAFAARLIGTTEKSSRLAVGGTTDGKAAVYAANPTTGQFPTTPTVTVAPFSGSTANLRVAEADVNGDRVPDTIVVTGPGVPTRFAVVSGADNTTLLVGPTAPFTGSETFTGGGFVAAADLDNDGRAELIFTPDRGGGPRVAIFSLVSGTATVRANFFGIDDPGFRGGARAGAGDVDGDGFADLAVAAGFQGGPRVALFDGGTLFGTPARLVSDFFAFADVLRNGVYVAIGDVDGDGFGDLIFGAGPGGGPRVLTVSGRVLIQQGAVAALATPLSNFFVAGADSDRGGVRVATVDTDGDDRADVAVGTGEGRPSRARAYLGKNFGGGEPTQFQDLDPFGATLADGIYVG